MNGWYEHQAAVQRAFVSLNDLKLVLNRLDETRRNALLTMADATGGDQATNQQAIDAFGQLLIMQEPLTQLRQMAHAADISLMQYQTVI